MDILYIVELIVICLIFSSLIAFSADIRDKIKDIIYNKQVKYYTAKHERKEIKENGK